MRIGIGLPSAVPGATPEAIRAWAAQGERAGFAALGATDRLVYDSLDPLVTLAVAAAHTTTAELVSTVLNIGYRGNPFVVAGQIASLDRLGDGRFTAGLGMGAWPDDYAVSDMAMTTWGARFESALAQMRRAWRGELAGAAGPVPALAPGRPAVLLAGLVPAGTVRAATLADGWVAPAFSVDLLRTGLDIVGTEWARLARPGRPRAMPCQDIAHFLQISGLDGHPQGGPVVLPGGRRRDIDVEIGQSRTHSRLWKPACGCCWCPGSPWSWPLSRAAFPDGCPCAG
ncbi:LLM class flavin-dependent oxidoreductase [Nocardia rhamnosiphila]|uniref:LLM class flavin-dependent oxidoreductase n=1 Tax=Nocardia rhamnosiphila TaxID=426716 RepID=UPI00340FF34E